jgi:hypothetical protein
MARFIAFTWATAVALAILFAMPSTASADKVKAKGGAVQVKVERKHGGVWDRGWHGKHFGYFQGHSFRSGHPYFRLNVRPHAFHYRPYYHYLHRPFCR